MSKDNRDMGIEEFEKEYNAHLEELRSRGFADNFLEMEKSGKWLPKTWFLRGYKCSQKEMQEKLDEAIEVIRFYASDTSYFTADILEYPPIDEDEGKRARDFLKARGE